MERILAIALLLLCVPSAGSAQVFSAPVPVRSVGDISTTGGKPVVGWVEKIRVSPGNLVMHAKLSPGSETSSISAQNIEKFDKNGKKWVRFEISDRYGKKFIAELPITRTTKIKQHGAESQERFVVELGLCLGRYYQEEEVTLVDRSDFEYEMLIGRSFIAGSIVLDPSLSYTLEPRCTPGENSIAMSYTRK